MTFAALLATLADLGVRHRHIGQAALTGTGEAPEGSRYPLVLIEADPLCEELTPQLDTYSMAMQVLDQSRDASGYYRAGAEAVADVLTRTKEWADQLMQQLRDEHPGWLDGKPSFLGLPEIAGTDLATGWRVEFRLKVPRNLDRAANAALFTPGADLPDLRALNDFSPAEIIAHYSQLPALRGLL